jgi:hypothetical protein
MARLIPLRSTLLKTVVRIACVAAVVCAPGSTAWAQHGGGHAGGGGHFGGGGGGHMSSPHVSAPPSPHFSAPVHAPGPIGAGTHNYVAAPPPGVHLSTRPGVNQPVIGNRIGNGLVGGATIIPAQPVVLAPPQHVVIGFPPAGNSARVLPLAGAGPLSFSGEGHEIWRNSASGNNFAGIDAAATPDLSNLSSERAGERASDFRSTRLRVWIRLWVPVFWFWLGRRLGLERGLGRWRLRSILDRGSRLRPFPLLRLWRLRLLR